MEIIRSDPADADALTKVAFAAKRHWGYPEAWIRRWEQALTVTPDYVRTNPTYAAVVDQELVGFCAVQIRADGAWLDHLWVLPAAMGKGAGQALFKQAENIARASGAASLRIVADPHAEGFYRRMGAVPCGHEDASIDGQARSLPRFEKIL